MPAKPMPQIRPKPTAAAAEAFINGGATDPAPVVAAVTAVAPLSTEPRGKRAAKVAAEVSPRRRVNLYLSKETARTLRLQAAEQEREMSEIAEEILSKHLKRSA